MIEISDKAKNELVKFFEDKEKSPVRVYLAPGGCSGPRLSLALDQIKDTDKVFDFDGGLQFCIDAPLLEQATPVKVDVTYTGFVVESELQLGGGCGSGCSSSGCGSSSGCCGS